MLKPNASSEKNKNIWISLTGYRLLLILKSLIEGDKTVNELIRILSENEITKKSVSKDTARLTVSTLKLAGCKIIRPTKANKYQYQLVEHPFNLKLTKEEVYSLLKLREVVSFQLDWQDILNLNELYKKIFLLTDNQEYIQQEKELRPLANVNKELLLELSSTISSKKKIQIQYLSPKFGLEEIFITPLKVLYENGKFNLWCYNYKYKVNSMLSIERIVKINSINLSDGYVEEKSYTVTYTLFGFSKVGFVPADNEEIIDKNEEYLTIKAKVENEFIFIQRLFSFGADFKIISPDFFREKLINKLKYMKNWYNDEEI